MGCETGGGAAVPPAPQPAACVPPTTIPGSEPTPWTQSGTSATPAYGKACRLVTEDVYSQPTNCADDDTLTLVTSSDGMSVAVTLEVRDDTGVSVAATVTLSRALAEKSYREAAGTATFARDPSVTGTVVDGTLCFDQKLSAATDALGELSLVVEQGGVHHALGGHFALPATLVDPAALEVKASGALDIDLR